MPIRGTYLPDLSRVLGADRRFCAGGVLALTAIARPADPFRGGRDYVLLVQERSSRVVNGAGRLAVIPKAFHRPLADHRADARIGATLRRELEEELFGQRQLLTVTETRRPHPGSIGSAWHSGLTRRRRAPAVSNRPCPEQDSRAE
ncbi:hypothetical protein [Amycolatopsis carbonis]|uniref:hypothetical protein n=1 Tax=Amycolatopsis carbonis TaxID=715471 RepID=UPI003DA70E52